jgi:transcriptional regulator with XRE-family HTH domain
MSLRELAQATGSSKGLLSQVENGVANPTLQVLTRIAAALDATLGELVRSPLTAPELIHADWADPEHAHEVAIRTLFTSFERRRLEVSESAMPAGRQSMKSAHGNASIEYAYVLSGQVTIASQGWSMALGTGDALRFSAEFDHSYRTDEQPARVLTIVAFADD